VSVVRIEREIGSGHSLVATFGVEPGLPLVGVELKAADVHLTMLRRVQWSMLAEMADEARVLAGLPALVPGVAPLPEDARRPRLPLWHLAVTAEAYTMALASGANPIPAVADRLKLKGSKRLITARNRVYQARAAGLLVRGLGGRRGARGGRLSPRAVEILERYAV
jgi:hypothetical protein